MSEYVVPPGGGEIGNRGKSRDEALEIRNHGGDLSLLEHDLRHPHRVRCSDALPGEIVTTVSVVPG
jgi:hypothetical protein